MRSTERKRLALEKAQADYIPHVTVVHQGDYLHVKHEKMPVSPPPSRKDGKVSGFSRQSRLRLLKHIAKTDWEKFLPAKFVTCTFPDHLPIKFNSRYFNRCRYLFFRMLEKELGKISYYWRIEWKPRLTGMRTGEYMPHMHLLLCRTGFVDYRIFHRCWRSVLHVKKATLNVKTVMTGKKAALYTSKYIGKLDDCSNLDNPANLNICTGRQWGISRISGIPHFPIREVSLIDDPIIDEARKRAAVGWKELEQWCDTSYTLLGPVAWQVASIIFGDGIADWNTQA